MAAERPRSMREITKNVTPQDSLSHQVRRVLGPAYPELSYLPEQIEAEMFYAVSVVDILNSKFAEKFGRVVIKKDPSNDTLHTRFWSQRPPALGFLLEVPQKNPHGNDGSYILVVKDGHRSRMSLLNKRAGYESLSMQGDALVIDAEDIVESFPKEHPQFEEVQFRNPSWRADACHEAVTRIIADIDIKTDERRRLLNKSVDEQVTIFSSAIEAYEDSSLNYPRA